MKKKVLLGMSGGVDSSVAVKLLIDEGYEVVGGTFCFKKGEKPDDAELVAGHFGIEHFFIDVEEIFNKKVINYFAHEYLMGRTPSPCVICNENIKFPVLLKKAGEIGATYIATGHYVQKAYKNGTYYISKGVDSIKDQSYYLWRLHQDVLRKTLFPLGKFNKSEIRKKALNEGLGFLLKKTESMGVCFLKRENYIHFLEHNFPNLFSGIGKGQVIDIEGNVIGEHEGYYKYTIGQKKGFSIKSNELLYVCDVRTAENKISVNKKEDIKSRILHLTDCYYHDKDDLYSDDIVVKIRGIGQNPHGHAKIKLAKNNQATINLEGDAWAPAPGQPVVFYKGNLLIGGGMLKKAN